MKYILFLQPHCFREAYKPTLFRSGIQSISVSRQRYCSSGIIPRRVLCLVCKYEIEDEERVLFHVRLTGYSEEKKSVVV